MAFGERLQLGVEVETCFIQFMEVMSANEFECDLIPQLLQPDDTEVNGDAGYSELVKHL